jgi:hypothetical protein
MGSWIDSLKEGKDKEAEAQTRLDDIRLHKARIIQAKSRDWFTLLQERVLADCAEMRAKFPNDAKLQPFVNTQTPGGFSLNGGGMPRAILRLDLQVNAQQIGVCESLREDFVLSPPIQQGAPIPITVGPQEELVFTFMGTGHDAPDSLSQHLISYVCGLSARSPQRSGTFYRT